MPTLLEPSGDGSPAGTIVVLSARGAATPVPRSCDTDLAWTPCLR